MKLLIITGSIVAIGAAILLLTALVVGAIHITASLLIRVEQRGAQRQLDWHKNKLRSAAWWFSEDSPTRELLADLAELSEWDARDKWRKARSKQI